MEAREKAFGVFGDAVLDTNMIVGVSGGVAYMEGGIVVPVGENGQEEAREWVAGLYEGGEGDEGDGGDDEAGDGGDGGDNGEQGDGGDAGDDGDSPVDEEREFEEDRTEDREEEKREWKRVTGEDLKEWKRLRDQGISVSEIARRAGRAVATVWRYLREMDAEAGGVVPLSGGKGEE